MSESTKGTVPPAAYAMHSWQLDAWERQEHPEMCGEMDVVRGAFGMYDGYVLPETSEGTTYVLGWIYGRNSANAT